MVTTPDDRIVRLLETVQRHIAEPLRVSDLAAIVNLSPSRFAHVFRQTVGVSPARHLQQLRIVRAGQLLGQTSLAVSEVMRLVGYSDQSHFARDFRRHFGTSPGAYRRECGRSG